MAQVRVLYVNVKYKVLSESWSGDMLVLMYVLDEGKSWRIVTGSV